MTEDEAKTKWCPAARFHAAPSDDIYSNRDDMLKSSIHSRCLGSDCMAWRWDEAKRTLAFLEAVQAYMKTQPKPNFNTATQAVYAESGGRYERIEGGCGLAGAVQ